jgi:hypothetical protein
MLNRRVVLVRTLFLLYRFSHRWWKRGVRRFVDGFAVARKAVIVVAGFWVFFSAISVVVGDVSVGRRCK